jgi:hypothetical protein
MLGVPNVRQRQEWQFEQKWVDECNWECLLDDWLVAAARICHYGHCRLVW